MAAMFLRVAARPAEAQTPSLSSRELTGSALAAVAADGRFRFADSAVNPPGQLSEAQAHAAALSFLRRDRAYDANGRPNTGPLWWSKEHGAPLYAHALAPCGNRGLYAATAYSHLPHDVSEQVKRTWGPHWIVPLCDKAGGVGMVLSFSALATELADSLATGGPLPWQISDLTPAGFPLRADGSMYSPEAVASYVFAKTGRRLRSVPELVNVPRPEAPVALRWRVELERPVTVRGADSGVTRDRDVLFVGFLLVFSASGLMDHDPRGTPQDEPWTDIVTKRRFRAELASHASHGVELVTVVREP